MLGVDFHRRGAIAEEYLGVLLRAKSGEPLEYEGRTVRITPPPVTPGGPVVVWGGGSVAAARRAGRHGLGFLAQRGDPALEHAYREESGLHGHEPGMCLLPDDDAATALFVAEDVELAWEELGPYLMHDVTTYAALNEGAPHSASLSTATSVEELRAEGASHRIVTVDEAVALVRAGTPLQLHPLIGGLPPETAWRYLHTVVDRVMPAATAP
jgi:alkanesulfonate monooxygenase SsuD/methylene tetrahydromethanopterin reductase-like flavin-dependent oxidoreductase (luciferase family)